MFKVRIINRAWLKSGIFGEHETLADAQVAAMEYMDKSDADRWEYEDGLWKAYVDGIDICALTVEIVEYDKNGVELC